MNLPVCTDNGLRISDGAHFARTGGVAVIDDASCEIGRGPRHGPAENLGKAMVCRNLNQQIFGLLKDGDIMALRIGAIPRIDQGHGMRRRIFQCHLALGLGAHCSPIDRDRRQTTVPAIGARHQEGVDIIGPAIA